MIVVNYKWIKKTEKDERPECFTADNLSRALHKIAIIHSRREVERITDIHIQNRG